MHEVIHARDHLRRRSLGWLACDWMEHFTVHGPGDVQGERVRHGDEYTRFIADAYAVDDSGRLLYDSAFLSRPKGCDKSGLAARFCLFEALGPCRFAGWATGGEVYRDPWGLGFRHVYKAGEPMGRPVRSPFIRCMATEEGQTGNVFDSIYSNLTEGPLSKVPGIDRGLTRVYLPGSGEISPSTASSAAKDGGRETFVAFDESHLYNRPELRGMYNTVTRNLRKRKRIAQTWSLETSTMFAPGEESIAEATYQQAAMIREGKVRRERLLFDHRWGECEDLSDEAELRAALVEAYGDAMAWNDVDALVDEFYDARKAPSDSRRYFLNAATSTSDAWLTEPEWAACADPGKVVADKDVIVLSFDGSRQRSRGVTDATALIGCRVSDGHLFELPGGSVWEEPQGAAGEGWQVPVTEVEAAVRQAFARYDVVGFYADPARWESYIAGWEAAYGSRLKVAASRAHPIEWWFSGRTSTVVRAVEQLHSAIIDRELTHDGSYALTRHALNARRRTTRQGQTITKEHPDSARKIDAIVAAVLAWQARLDAVAAGVGQKPKGFAPMRIR